MMCSRLLALILHTVLLLRSSTSHGVRSQVTSKGSWELLTSNAGVSAMHMMLLPTIDKVIIFDRTDYGPSNITLAGGACREDLNDLALQRDCWAHSIEYDIASNSIRPLTLLTDTWCSSGGLNAEGDLIQTGGFNDGARAARRFRRSCASSCDWQEAADQLRVGRWYASNQLLPDGTFIVVGGRRQFNYEFFPKSEDGAVYGLPFLAETSDIVENNLYPFLHLSTDGNLFIFANSKSILLNFRKHIVVRRYPDMPGGEAHNYPSSGSSVMLPIFASSGAGEQAADVLVCGGAPPTSNLEANDGKFVPASSSCGRIRITDANPRWVMRAMPMRRVMGDMVMLPTCDVLIINGAQRGTAGWGVARDPALWPLLYAPYADQFTVMKPSRTARLYHSTAILLPDARVLVGGGNPHINYNFTDPEFPTQLSMEAFSPPYLDPGYSVFRPRVALLSADVGYGQSFALRFEVGTLVSTGDVQVNLLSPAFTTHAYAMNQRMLRLQCVGLERLSAGHFEMTMKAPPSPLLAPPGYYLLFVVHSTIPSVGAWIRMH